MRSEFAKTLKQHRDALTDELEKLGKHRQAQLAEWDIEQNESDYEFYFNAGWNAQQSKVGELTLQVAEMKSRLNDAYTDGQSAMYTARQSKVDELQRRNQMLNDNIKEQGQKLVYQNEVIETQSEKLLGLRDEKAELQKRVDAVKQLIQEYRDPPTEDKTFQHALSIVAYELEQALKGGSND